MFVRTSVGYGRHTTKTAKGFFLAVILYGTAAYLAAPEYWWLEDRKNFGIEPDKMITLTVDGIEGDPINVGFVGSEQELTHAFVLAAWHPADAITLRSSIEIGESVILDRPYPDAPVSTLLFDGRKQDLAFENTVGTSADRRHHVRIWKLGSVSPEGRAQWLGSASYDRGVGLSHDTGQITHHIGANIDAERDFLINDMLSRDLLASVFDIRGIGPTKNGRNGGGDPYFTDGITTIGVLRMSGKDDNDLSDTRPDLLENK